MKEVSVFETKWASQLRKGNLELAILAALAHRTRYGLELLQHLHKYPSLNISEGTLYPLLDRLKRDGLVHAYWRQEDETRPRKFFELTTQGHKKLNLITDLWRQSISDTEKLLSELTPPKSKPRKTKGV